MKKLLAVSTIGLSALAFIPSQAQAFVLIDNFNTGDIFEQKTPGNSASGSVAGAPGDIINNSNRDYLFNVTGSGRSNATLAVDGLAVDGGVPTAGVSSPPNATGTAKLTYNDNAPYDLISTDNEYLIGFDVKTNLGPATAQFTINGVPGLAGPYTVTPAPGRFTVPFTDFPAVDFNNVSSIELLLSGPNGYTLEIDNFGTNAIPEPMTILGTAFALTTLPGLKKAYSKKKAKA
jgi:hypothetical protein